MDRKARKEEIIKMNFPRLCVVKNNKGACGLAVLAAVAMYYGKQFTPEQFEYLFKICDATPGLDGDLLPKYLKPLGIRVEIKKNCTPEDIKNAILKGIPCAVAFSPLEDSHGRIKVNMFGGNNNHLAAIVGISKNKIYLADSGFCEGQLVDWQPLPRFVERWFNDDDCGNFPEYEGSPEDRTVGEMFLFHAEQKAESFDNIWNKTAELEQRYKKVLSGHWEKGELAKTIKMLAYTEREAEKHRQFIESLGGKAEWEKWMEQKRLDAGFAPVDPNILPVELELPPEMLADCERIDREVEAIARIKPCEYYEAYLKGVPLPVPASA